MSASGGTPEDRAARWLADLMAGRADHAEASEHLAAPVLAGNSVEQIAAALDSVRQQRTVGEVDAGPVPASRSVSLLAAVDGPVVGRVVCFFDTDGKLVGITAVPDEVVDLTETTRRTADLTDGERARVHDLFEDCYERADHGYLDRSLSTLEWITMAADAEGHLTGFSLGAQRRLDLPGVGETRTTLAGLACVHPDRRRRGLFRWIANVVLAADGAVTGDERVLNAGRMSHPASYRVYRDSPTVVPRTGTVPNRLQQGVGAAVAAAYGVDDFDPTTFVCRGRGTPVGYPRVVPDVAPEEWEVFAPVDRDRGDALLAVVWGAHPPEGW